ncbi:hypothetical protein [Methanobacterium sp.]|uniref:hypothetical protein n=1 Tax=Methanobacterium sp. TaxID=2164 RepID=UPI002ABB93D5|nr:hypothetical protein [Methanobacterium sp.]MDY9922779.1 hypothetical protein [Methanobacterium sp.]
MEEEKYQKVKDLLYGYTGNGGVVINIDILKNENGPGAIIWMVLICFKSLLRLLKVTDESYSSFIEKHKKDFMDFYKNSIIF